MEGMGKSKKSLTVNELEPGMIIAEKVYSGHTVLVNRGVVVTETIITRLRDKFIFDNIEVFCEENGEIDFIEVVKEKTVEEIEQTFKELSFNLEGLFDNLENRELKDIKEIQEFADKIKDELSSARTVIKDIVLHGSGKDYIFRHSVNVAALSCILGKWLGMDDESIEKLACAAVLHDFGKTKIHKDKLDKGSELNHNGPHEMKVHPIIGYNAIREIPNISKLILDAVLMHHERLDGSGYNMGVKEDRIGAFARIIAIADTFDEVNSTRIYVTPKGPFEALEMIHEESFGKLDYGYCNVFLEHVINFYISESVLLSNNKIARIIQIDINDLERPLLLDDDGFIDLKRQANISVERLLL